MFGLEMVVDLVLGLSKQVTSFTETEIDDKVVEIIQLLTDGDYSKALIVLAEIVDVEEIDKVKDK